MSYQSRSSRINSLTRNDDIYWSTVDSFSNVTDVTRSSSHQSIRAQNHNYIDPWDLENYAYIQRSMESDVSSHMPHSVHDDISNPHYMQSGRIEDCPCYAGLDEQLFYNAKYEMIPDSFTDMDEMSSNSFSGSTVSTIQYRSMPYIHFPPPPMQPSSAYECYANVIIPKRRVPFDNMAPTPLHAYPNASNEVLPDAYQPQPDYYYDQFGDGCSQHDRRQSVSLPCYECIDMQSTPLYYGRGGYGGSGGSGSGDNTDLYDQRKHLERFGLSKKGLLQIDYSLSWMNLQRLISSK